MKRHVNRALLVGTTICCAVVALLGFGGAVSAQTSTTSVDIQQRCVIGGGLVSVVVVPAAGSEGTVTVTVGNLAPRSQDANSNTPAKFVVTGRPDGPLKVETKVDGVMVDTRTLTVQCRAVVSEPTASSTCLAGRGRVDVSVPAGADYTVSFPGLADRVIKAGSSGRTTWTGRRNGAYTITAVSADNVKYSLEVAVECGPRGIPGTGLNTTRSCSALADDLRARALEKMAPRNLDMAYYELDEYPGPDDVRAWAIDAVDQALPESRPDDADVAKFKGDQIFTASLGLYTDSSMPKAHPNSVAVLTTDDGVIIIDQRPRDLVLTRYNASGTVPKATLRVEGVFVRARLVDDVVQLVTQSAPRLASTDAAGISATKTGQWIPQYTWTEGTNTESRNLVQCSQVYTPEDSSGFSVVALTSINATTLKPNPGVGVVADEATVLLEGDQAVVATRPWDPLRVPATLKPGGPIEDAYVTSIHSFDFSDPKLATYRASGRVRGELRSLDRLSDGRLATMSCEGASWWNGADDGGCYLNTLSTIGDSLRVTGAFGNFGRRRDGVEVRFGTDLAVVATNSAASLLVDLSVPGSFANGPLNGTSRYGSYSESRWNAIRLTPDRLLLIDGNQLALLDISNVGAPRRLSTAGDRDPDWETPERYWLDNYFEDSFSWDPEQGRLAMAFITTSQNDPNHSGGYSYEGVAAFTIKDDKIKLVDDGLNGTPSYESVLRWRTHIDGNLIRVAKPGWNPSTLAFPAGS